MAQFNFTPLRNTGIGLVKKFGKHVPCTLLRAAEGTPSDPSKPWRLGAATIQQFKFTGVVSTIAFPKRSDASADGDVDIIMPGDIVDTESVADPLILCGFPLYTDRIDVAGIQYSVIGIRDVTPDDKPIIITVRGKAWPSIIQAPQTPF